MKVEVYILPFTIKNKSQVLALCFGLNIQKYKECYVSFTAKLWRYCM